MEKTFFRVRSAQKKLLRTSIAPEQRAPIRLFPDPEKMNEVRFLLLSGFQLLPTIGRWTRSIDLFSTLRERTRSPSRNINRMWWSLLPLGSGTWGTHWLAMVLLPKSTLITGKMGTVSGFRSPKATGFWEWMEFSGN